MQMILMIENEKNYAFKWVSWNFSKDKREIFYYKNHTLEN